MVRFIAGVLLGLVLGLAGSSLAAIVVGKDGPLDGWTVSKDGEEICSDPTVTIATKEIECD